MQEGIKVHSLPLGEPLVLLVLFSPDLFFTLLLPWLSLFPTRHEVIYLPKLDLNLSFTLCSCIFICRIKQEDD